MYNLKRIRLPNEVTIAVLAPEASEAPSEKEPSQSYAYQSDHRNLSARAADAAHTIPASRDHPLWSYVTWDGKPRVGRKAARGEDGAGLMFRCVALGKVGPRRRRGAARIM